MKNIKTFLVLKCKQRQKDRGDKEIESESNSRIHLQLSEFVDLTILNKVTKNLTSKTFIT